MNPTSPYINFVSEDFDASRTTYGLTIQTSLGGFSFVIADTPTRQVVALQGFNGMTEPTELMQALSDFCKDKAISPSAFNATTCIIDDSCYAIVPTPLFDIQHAATYLDFCNDNEAKNIHSETVTNAGCKVVFGTNESLEKLLKDFFPKLVVRHAASLIVEKILPCNKGLTQYVNVRQSDFDIMVADNDKLLFLNSFAFKGLDDFVYYLVTVMRQYGSTEEIGLSFLGMVMPDSEVVKLTKRYVREVRFQESSLSPDALELPKHYFYITLSNT